MASFLTTPAGSWCRGEHVLIISPHPDDECLAAAGVIVKSLSKNDKIKVVMMTCGDSSLKAAQLYTKKNNPSPEDFKNLGLARAKETGQALAQLGLGQENIRFLGYPDGGLTLASEDFDSVPHAVGFNNHMGSAATSSDRIMRPILQVAQERNFFVLDSKTIGNSRIPFVSKELGIPCVERDVFLDNMKNLNYVKKQLYGLSQKALKNGKAIGIGHVGGGGKVTAQALKEMIPQMKEMGIEFVFLSEIVY